MMTTTFYAPSKFARYVQLLVMKYDGRFVHNPLFMSSKNANFKISFDEVSPEYVRSFHIRIDILNSPWV